LQAHVAAVAVAVHVAFTEQAVPLTHCPAGHVWGVCGEVAVQRALPATHAPHVPCEHTPPAPHAVPPGRDAPVSVQALPVAAQPSVPEWQSLVGLHAGGALGFDAALLSSQSVVGQFTFHSAGRAPGQTVAHAVVAAQYESAS
jgi:hypothetical protein